MGWECDETNQGAKKMRHLLKSKAVTERALTQVASSFYPKPVVTSGEPEKGLSIMFIAHLSYR